MIGVGVKKLARTVIPTPSLRTIPTSVIIWLYTVCKSPIKLMKQANGLISAGERGISLCMLGNFSCS